VKLLASDSPRLIACSRRKKERSPKKAYKFIELLQLSEEKKPSQDHRGKEGIFKLLPAVGTAEWGVSGGRNGGETAAPVSEPQQNH